MGVQGGGYLAGVNAGEVVSVEGFLEMLECPRHTG